MNCKGLYLGTFAVVCYVAAVLIGGHIREGYSHYSDTISQLMAQGTEPIIGMVVLFFLFNIALVLLGVGPAKLIHTDSIRNSLRVISVIGLIGILIYFFPTDPRGEDLTTTGIIHYILAAVFLLLIIATPILGSVGLKQLQKSKYVFYSWGFAGLIFVGSIGTLLCFPLDWESIGMWQRIGTGTWLVWLVWYTLTIKHLVREETI